MTPPNATAAPARVRRPVDPREAAFGVQVGDPLIVDVDGHGSGWAILAVYSDAYDLYRDCRDLYAVPAARRQHPGQRILLPPPQPSRLRRLHLRRGDGAPRVPRGQE